MKTPSVVTHNATNVTATWATLNGEITHIRGKLCDYGSGSCDYGGVQPLFAAIPQGGMDPFEVQFYDMSTGNPTSWQWDFGDGTGSTQQHPTHRYDKPGTYPVTLWIKNEFNSGILVTFEYILVSDAPEPVSLVTKLATNVTGAGATLNGALIDIKLESSVNVFFKYGTEKNLDVYTYVDAGILSSEGGFSAPVFGLTAGNTYYFQACATTGTGKEVCSGILPFVYEETVVSADVFFKYGAVSDLGTYIRAEAGTLLNAGQFDVIIPIEEGITYYFQACAATSTGDLCGEIVSFTAAVTPTPRPMPSVATNNATDVTGTGATLNGELTDLGLESSVSVFFKYGTDQNFGTYFRTDARTLLNAGLFDAAILTEEGVTYYFQACATTATRDLCGGIVSFTTAVEIPSVTIVTDSAIRAPFIFSLTILNGELTDLGLESSVDVFFKYGTDPTLRTYTLGGAETLSRARTFYMYVPTEEGTTYYFQACAATSTGDVCGETLSFMGVA